MADEPEVVANIRTYLDYKKRMKDHSLTLDVLELDGILRAYDALQVQLAVANQENERLAKIAHQIGKLEISKGIERRVLSLRWDVSETALEYARDPEEVFRFAIQEGMDEFRKWKRERQPQAFGEVAAEAFGEAFANARRTHEREVLTNPTSGDTV